MLTHLAIKDFAVVAAAELDFGAGLTVISGETGAGKSLLVDALAFLSGQRADSGMVRHGAERAELVAVFELDDAPAALEWLRGAEFDDGGECQLRRTLRADGGSRAWINGRPATVGQLAELASTLVEIHGQHEHQALLSRTSQLALLDAFGGHERELAAVRMAAEFGPHCFVSATGCRARADMSEHLAWLEHQLGELQRESLEPESIAELVGAHRRHAHSAALIASCEHALAQLGGIDGPALSHQLQQIRTELSRQVELEPRLGDVDSMLDSAAIQMDEALVLLEQIRADLDLDPSAFDDLERRLSRLHDLARKHRIQPESLAAQRDTLMTELEALRGAGDRVRELDAGTATAASGLATSGRRRWAHVDRRRRRRCRSRPRRCCRTWGWVADGLKSCCSPTMPSRPDPPRRRAGGIPGVGRMPVSRHVRCGRWRRAASCHAFRSRSRWRRWARMPYPPWCSTKSIRASAARWPTSSGRSCVRWAQRDRRCA